MFEESSTVVYASLVILLLLCGIIISVFVANRRHINQQVKMARREAEYEKELRQAEQEVQERVMANVARELHDNLGQRLTVLKMHLERHRIVHSDIAADILPITADLDTTVAELRQISKSLNSDFLENAGLQATMQLETERIEKVSGIKVHWEEAGEPALDKNSKIMMFRIFQEVLNNTLKHSGCSNIHIRLADKPFRLQLRDDGRGFDKAEKLAGNAGSGLKNMIRRAAMADIKAELTSEPGKGTAWLFTGNI